MPSDGPLGNHCQSYPAIVRLAVYQEANPEVTILGIANPITDKSIASPGVNPVATYDPGTAGREVRRGSDIGSSHQRGGIG
jgi:hypothetical protein